MKLKEAKRQFLKHLETERGRSGKTIENYDRYVTKFLAYAQVDSPKHITATLVREFHSYLNRQPGTKVGGRMEPMKRKTQNYYLIALRAFLKYLHQRGVATLSPKAIALTSVPVRSPDFITPSELTRLIAAPDTTTVSGLRDVAILTLLASTGLRISELCSLSIADIDGERDEFTMSGQDNQARVVLLSAEAKHAIGAYLKARSDTSDALFVQYGKNAQNTPDLRLSPRTVQRILKQNAVKAGITRRVTPHIIRHSFAIALLRNGTDLSSVQTLLGHVHIGTTNQYAQKKNLPHKH